MKCLNCESELEFIVLYKGHWYYCTTCGCLHRQVNEGELTIYRKPAIIGLIKMMRNP